MNAKPPRDSYTTLAQLMLPSDANPQGNVHGGTIMKLVDTAGAIAAHRHARRRVVTAAVDSMHFLHPVHVGNVVTLTARVTAVWRTSLEAAVEVEAENVLTGERRHTASAFLVFAALPGDDGQVDLPPLRVETDEERAMAQAAESRRQQRLAARGARRATALPETAPGPIPR